LLSSLSHSGACIDSWITIKESTVHTHKSSRSKSAVIKGKTLEIHLFALMHIDTVAYPVMGLGGRFPSKLITSITKMPGLDYYYSLSFFVIPVSLESCQ
jgi:hypothetical protein